MASKSKKIQKVIDGIRAWNLSSSTNIPRSEVEETLKSDNFKYGKIVQYGFPNDPSCIAYEPVQKLLIIGTKSGSGRILGRPGVDHNFKQPSRCGIIKIIFIVNEGTFLTICNDESIYQWNYQNKPVELIQSLQFKRETLNCAYLSPGANWLYVGTVKGNVFFVNIKKFCISGYVINWNKAIDLSQSHHPGSVIEIGESPSDSNRLLIGFSTGFLALWNLKEKAAKFRFKFNETLWGISWFPDGKNFISCHSGGYLVTWNSRQSNTPLSVIQPHNRDCSNDANLYFEPIKKVVLLSTKNDDCIMVFSGGTPKPSNSNTSGAADTSRPQSEIGSNAMQSSLPSLTVMKNKRLTILQMDYPIIDFVQLSELSYSNSIPSDPFGIAILLENDLMVIDLLSPNYPSFENPYPIDLHVSAVTCVHYVSDCPGDFVAALYKAKPRAKRPAPPPPPSQSTTASSTSSLSQAENSPAPTANISNTSPHEWPINGGQWGSILNSNSELIITGHEDGSLRFWDATGTSLTSLYKFRLSTFLEKAVVIAKDDHEVAESSSATPTPSAECSRHNMLLDDCGCPCTPEHTKINSNVITAEGTVRRQLAIEKIQLCTDSKRLMIAGRHFVTLLSFTKREVICDVPVLDINIQYDIEEEAEVITEEYVPMTKQFTLNSQTVNYGVDVKDLKVFVGVKAGLIKWAPGYQPDVVCRLGSCNANVPSNVSSIGFNSNYGLMAFGNEQGIAIVDFVQKVCLMSSGTPDLYGSNDPYNRVSWSPSNRKEDSTKNSTSSDLQQNTTNGVPSSAGVSSNDQCFDSGAGSSRTGSSKSSYLYKQELKRNKSTETGHFSRSTSSSTSSLDNISCETITSISFGDTYSRKSDGNQKPCLWLGTSLGTALIINLNLPDLRTTQPVIVSPSGTLYRLRGAILCIGFLDSSGDIISPSATTITMATSFSCSGAGGTGINAMSGSNNSNVNSGSSTTVGPQGGSTPTGLSSQDSVGPGSSSASYYHHQYQQQQPSGMIKKTNYISKQSTVSSSNSIHGISSGSTTSMQNELLSSATAADAANDNQFAVLCSEKSAEVISLPSQSMVAKIKITETSAVVQASLIAMAATRGGGSSFSTSSSSQSPSSCPCLVAQLGNGHLMSFSLPSLRLLMDIDAGSDIGGEVQCPLSLGNLGMLITMISFTELEKSTISAEFVSNIKNAQGDLYIPKELPSPPKKSFFESLFNNTAAIDRDELFGEAGAGKGSVATATVTTSKMMDKAQQGSANAQSEIAKARMAALERGEKLSEAELKTQEMMDQAKTFSKTASALAAKYEKRDKRWGLLF